MSSPIKLFLFASFLMTIHSFSWAQGMGLIFSTLTERPKVLELEKVVPFAGKAQLMHSQSDPLTIVSTVFLSKDLADLEDKILKSFKGRITCDGDYQLVNDFQGKQSIAIKHINVCVDEDGWVVAHSVGRPIMSIEEFNAAVLKIAENQTHRNISGGIFQGMSPKEVVPKHVNDSAGKAIAIQK